MRFGRLTVIGDFSVKAHEKVECRCDCGSAKFVMKTNLVQGRTNSCGCLQKERASQVSSKLNGATKTRTYRIWAGMIGRCRVKSNAAYARYGANGITVCARWLDFRNFLEDMGECADGMSIDRVDNEKGYEPGNCRWATAVQQARNQRGNKWIDIHGDVRTLAEWCELKGMPYFSVARRLRRGWSVERALNEPLDQRKCNRRHART